MRKIAFLILVPSIHVRRFMALMKHTEIVTSLRRPLIQTLLEFLRKEVQSRMPDNSACLFRGRNLSKQNASCDALILGGMFQHIGSKRPGISFRWWRGIPVELNELMETMSDMFAKLPCLNDHHVHCSPAKKYAEFETKTRQDARWQSGLQLHHKEQLEAQRSKSGYGT